MAAPDLRSLSLSTLILAGLQIGLPWTVGGRSPAGQASLVLLAALAGAIGLALGGPGPRRRPSVLPCLAGILIGVSALHTIYPDRTVQSLLLLLSYLVAAALAAEAAREIPWAAPSLLASISAAGALVSLVGIVRISSGEVGGLYARLFTGPFGYPNAAGGYLLLTAGAAIAMARTGRCLMIRASAIAAACLSLLGLALTRSQGAMLAAAIGLGVWAAIDRAAWWPRRRLWLGAAALGLVLALTLAPRELMGLPLRLWSLVGTGAADTSFTWRLHILRWTWAMVGEHPWWGVGPGAFPVALLQYQSLPYVAGQNPHNLYLELAAEYGIPAALLAVLALGGVAVRAAAAVVRAPAQDPARRRLAVLVAALGAFAVHSAVDLDWSYPAIATTAATLLGLAAAPLRNPGGTRVGASGIWRGGLRLVLILAAVLALSRFYAALLVADARGALATAETTAARRDLTWALRLNPLSFASHQWMAWTRLRSGDREGAIEAAERTTRIAPADPNTHFLAGEVSLAAGRVDPAEAHFRRAVDWAPNAHLRFHAGLLEALARNGKAAEARWAYEQASGIFTPTRVLQDEARCLAPGDRYLLARMSRRAARLYGDAHDLLRQSGAAERARILEQPDSRGICITPDRPGQTSPETSVLSFWRALGEGGLPRAGQFLAPDSPAMSNGKGEADLSALRHLQRTHVLWIDSLTGGEREVRIRYEIATESSPGQVQPLCSQSDLRLIGNGWYLNDFPILEARPCFRSD